MNSKARGLSWAMCGASGHLRRVLKDMGVTARIGGLLYNDVTEVVETLRAVPVAPRTEPAS